MRCRVEVGLKPGYFDAVGEGVRQGIRELGLAGVERVSASKLYFLEGDLSPQAVETLCQKLLADLIVNSYRWDKLDGSSEEAALPQGAWVVEVAFNPGVQDSVAESALLGARTMGLRGLRQVKTGSRYLVQGQITEGEVRQVAERLLANGVIQHYELGELRMDFTPIPRKEPVVRTIPLREASPEELLEISRRGILALDLAEMQAIQKYYRRLGRDPTDAELETLAQTWSEHCVHKTFKATLEYEEREDGKVVKQETIHNLLRTYLMAATRETAKPWLLSAFVDNAGIVAFGDDYEVSFKVETHNHPSAIEPFGGANTGTGGVLRDIIGVSAKPIAATDVLLFGPLDLPFAELPREVLHPRRIYEGVVKGIEDYGNKFGVPTLNGALLFHPGYVANPLVYCGAAGIAPRGRHPRRLRAGDLVLLVGGRTGRDGIHGATFSSVELTEKTGRETGSAVQIGNPIMEKKFHDCILRARDEGLYDAITDCGGGGLSSAVGEMAAELGATVDLAKVPLKYEGLEPWEIWLSEAQERMILAVPPEKVEHIRKLFAEEDVEATVIGEFTGDGHLRLRYGDLLVADLSMEFLHQGRPERQMKAVWEKPGLFDPEFPEPRDLTRDLLAILGSPNVASKESVVRRYDHEVQGGTVLKPLVGAERDGPSDAAILKPLFDSPKGLVIACGLNPLYSAIDPYWMAASAIDEALRNAVAVGGDLSTMAILDNFCWGNPNLPDRLGALVRAVKACYDIATGYGVPFISGKDSLNNEYRDTASGQTISIPPTLLISAMSVIPDVSRVVSMDLKEAGDAIYILGETFAELGGSHYYLLKGYTGASVPKVDPARGKGLMESLYRAISQGLVRAGHDCSEGGIGVAAAEMAFAGGFGMRLYLRMVPASSITRSDTLLFSESNSRFLVEVAAEDRQAFEEVMAGKAFAAIGEVLAEQRFEVSGLDGRAIVSASLAELKGAWQATLGGEG